MADLLNIRSQSERGARRKKRAEAAIDLLANLGLPKKVRVEDGFTIHASNLIPELKNARIDAPAGLVTVFSTFDGIRIYENDYYMGGGSSSGDLYIFDSVVKKYIETLGSGVGDWVTFLLQGQPENVVLSYIPYANSAPAVFSRNGSWANNEPGGGLGPGSFLYPDSWPCPCIMPEGVLESIWLSVPGNDIIYASAFYASMYAEVSRISYISNNKGIGGRTLFSTQKLDPYRPASSVWFMPVDKVMSAVVPVAGFKIPQAGSLDRKFAALVKYDSGVYSTDDYLLSYILPPISSPPPGHSGDLMPAELREIILTDPDISGRMSPFYAFSSTPDRSPVLFASVDLTNTQQGPFPDGPDFAWFADPANIEERDWRISCHFLDTETGDSWSYTAAQFWDLLRDRAVNLPIEEDWRTAPCSEFVESGWFAALLVFNQFFGRPDHNFIVPHDTWTFHAEDDDLYAWTRYYGEVRIGRTGIFGLDAGSIIVPSVVTATPGVRPTIRYSGRFGESQVARYICICEKLERSTSSEDLPQGQKEILGLYVGTPFADSSWEEFGTFSIESDTDTWTLCHVRIISHDFFDDPELLSGRDSISLIGIARKRFIDPDTYEEVIEYYSAVLSYNSLSGGTWSVVGKYSGINTIDPVYGERWSADLCLFGDDVLSPKMMKYLSPPVAASQLPYAPYDTYYSGLP